MNRDYQCSREEKGKRCRRLGVWRVITGAKSGQPLVFDYCERHFAAVKSGSMANVARIDRLRVTR